MSKLRDYVLGTSAINRNVVDSIDEQDSSGGNSDLFEALAVKIFETEAASFTNLQPLEETSDDDGTPAT